MDTTTICADTTSSFDDRTIRLTDGRQLGYRDYGQPSDHPVFVFHGIPGSRCGVELVADLATRHGLRLIGVDRPGIGLSTFQPRRTFLDWPSDVQALADTLGLSHFAVVGSSGGAAYVAACAARMPERLTFTGIISGMGPLDVPGGLHALPLSRTDRLLVRLAQRSPHIACRTAAPIVARRTDPRRPGLLERMKREMAPADVRLLEQPPVVKTLFHDAAEALKQGKWGVTWDLLLYTRPWGFQLNEISVPVHLWHGEADLTVPPHFGRVIAAAIPDCRATYWPDEGHLMMISRAEEIVDTIIGNIAA
jgi:pimeloyl-ACP methyl ester carboxylesterase